MSQPSSRSGDDLKLEEAQSMLVRLANQAEATDDARAATILLNTAKLLREALPLRMRAEGVCH